MCPEGWVRMIGEDFAGVRCLDLSGVTEPLGYIADRVEYFETRMLDYLEPMALILGLVVLLLAVTAVATLLR